VSSATVMLMLAVFGACSVEAVEALTIVLASGTTRGWRSAMEGTGAALVALGVIVGAVGVPLVVLGLSWLRKAILRASGHKAKHDEDAIYEQTSAALRAEGGGHGTRDSIGFVVAFKGVFLEGMEVVLIVISLGASQHRLGDAALAAAAAVVLVSAVGLVVSRQLSEVPENTIKTLVGIMLTSFGLFWLGEGVGVRWPGSDLAIPILVGLFATVTAGTVAVLKTQAPAPPPTGTRLLLIESEASAASRPAETDASAKEKLAP
jgi:uncharacterized membrane protein